MTKKPTYEELEQKIRKLELEAERRNEVERTLNQQAQILSSIKDTIVIITPEMKTIYANQTAKDLFGDRPEMFTEPCYRFFKNSDTVCENCPVLKTIQDEKPHNTIMKFYDRNGEEIWRFNTAFPFYERDGQVIAGIEIVTDYTPQKRAEIALQESEGRYRALFENMMDGVAIYEARNEGEDFTFIDFNKAGERINNIHKEALIGKSVMEVFPAVREFGLLDVFKRVWKTGKPEHHPVAMYKDERESGWRNNFVYKLPSGEIVAIYSDETERKKAEESLQKSELKLRLLTETIEDVFWMSTCGVGKMIYISPAYETLWERSRESLYESPSSFLKAIHPEDLNGYLGVMDEYHKNGKPYEWEYRIIRKDGEVRWIHEKGYPVPDSSDEEPLMTGFCTDITEQKRTEQRLSEAILRQREAVKAGNVGLWDWDLLTNKVRYSAEWKRQIGYEEDEISNDFEEWQSRVHPDDLEATLKEIRQSIAEKRLEHKVEFRFRHRDGSYRWILAPGSILQDENGRVIRMLGSHIDITDRMRAEEELRKSERLHREAQRIAKIGHWELDSPSGTPTWSEEIFHIFGLDPESSEPSFAAHVNIIHGEDWALLDRSIQELNTNGTPFDIEFRILLANGESRWMHARGSADKGEDGNLTRMFGTAQDITDRKQAEDAVRESEEKFRGLAEDNFDMIFLTDTEGNITYISPASERIFGFKPEEMVNKHFLTYLAPTEVARVTQLFSKKLQGMYVDILPIEVIKRDGTHGHIELNASLVSKSGEVVGTQGVIRDVTEQKKAEEKRKALESQLQQSQKMEAVGTLAGGIAHDFNNILAIILGNAELAADDVPDSNPASESLKEIHKASIRAKDMVQQLLAFSRKTDEESKPLDMVPIIKESMKMLRSAIPTSVEFKQQISDAPCNVMGDAAQINQVVMNLVTNAADAMSEEGGVLEVALENMIVQGEKPCFDWVLSPGTYVRLRMRDTGEGIAPKIMDRIFEPYYTTKEVGKGTGMGLSVVHGIVKRHGGGIRVESESGKGTLFEIYFPSLEETAEEEKKPDGEIKGGSERILFVDDEASMVDLNQQRLERLDYDVKSTTKPLEALEWFKADPDQFDVIITDMTMPRMTGDRLAAEVLKIRPDMQVIICTGYSERMSAKKAEALGVHKYIEKPIDLRDLASALREVLDEK